MRHAILLIALTACLPAQDWFVSGSGSDAAAGTSQGTAFRTLKKAATLVDPGDTVWVMDGTYANDWPTGDVVHLSRSGTADAWITWRALPGHRPEIVFNGWNGIRISGSYQILDGLTVTGNNANVTLAQAEADYANASPDPRFNGNGIMADGRGTSAKPHHLTIRNCTVRACGGGGIAIIQADHITIEDCRVHGNAWYSRYANSGISLYQLVNADAATGYRNVIRRNRVWDNASFVKWKAYDRLSDGNGIIIDDSKNTQNGSTNGPYQGRTLVAGNLSVGNGGSGIHSYESERVAIVFNTAWGNGLVVGYPEIFANSSNDVLIANNIMRAKDGGAVNSNHANTAVVYTGNVHWNGTAAVTGAGTITADPRFVAPGADLATADFRLRADSPALDSAVATAVAVPASDLDGQVRPQGAGADRGASERDALAPAAPSAPSVVGGSLSAPRLAGTAEPGATVRIRAGATVIGSVLAGSDGAWSWQVAPALAPGAHSLTAQAVDGAGNAGPIGPALDLTVAAGGGGGGGSAVIAGGGDSGGCGAGGAASGLLGCLVLGLRRRRYSPGMRGSSPQRAR